MTSPRHREDTLAAVIGDCRLADMDDGRHGATERDEIVSAVMAPRAGSGDFLAADQNQARAVEHHGGGAMWEFAQDALQFQMKPVLICADVVVRKPRQAVVHPAHADGVAFERAGGVFGRRRRRAAHRHQGVVPHVLPCQPGST